MNNYLIVNAYLKTSPFENLKSSLEKAFLSKGEKLIVLTNDKAYSLVNSNGNKQPILFFDKDTVLGALLEKSGYKLINSIKTIEICDDKAKTYAVLKGKIDMPETVIAPFTYAGVEYDNYDFLKEAEKKIPYPVVVKSSVGSFGCQVALAENYDELKEKTQELSKFGRVIYQQFIATSKGKDIRVYVIGGRAVALGMRKNDFDFKSNVTSGGEMLKINDGEYENYKQLAIKAAAVVKADFAGVDLLIGDGGKPVVCEINSNAHFYALSKASGVDVAEKIAEYYLSFKR